MTDGAICFFEIEGAMALTLLDDDACRDAIGSAAPRRLPAPRESVPLQSDAAVIELMTCNNEQRSQSEIESRGLNAIEVKKKSRTTFFLYVSV